MKEILRPNSNLEGPKSRLPIGQEPKIEASDWSRADDFKNSSHRPFVKKFLSLHSFWHHSGVFGVIPKTKSHFAVIESIMEKLRYDSFHFILKSFIICFRVTQDGLYHLLSTPALSAHKGNSPYHSHYSTVNHLILDSFISFDCHLHHSTVIHHLFQSDSGWFAPPPEYPWTQRP